MKNLVLLVSLLLICGCTQNQKVIVSKIIANPQWAFIAADSAVYADTLFDDSPWVKITTLRTWEDQGFKDYDGFGWYRQNIEITGEIKKQASENGGLMINFDNADDADELFFNGTLVGSTGAMPPNYESKYGVKRKYIVPAEIVKAGRNLIAVRVYDGGGGGGLISDSVTIHPMSEIYKLQLSVNIADEDWVFMGNPQADIGFTIDNKLNKAADLNLVLKVTSDDFQPVHVKTQRLKLQPNTPGKTSFSFSIPAPGFYRCAAYLEKDGISGDVQNFNIGYEPEKIVSATDSKDDFEAFWKNTRQELDKVAPNYRMTLLKDKSAGARNLYQVKMQSFGNVTIEGFYAVPKAPGKYPVIIGYMGYGSEPYLPGSDNLPDFAEFILSVRGQGIQKAANTYGDWIVNGLDNRDNYYYRGAFMDLVRAIDFVAQRPEVDAEKIVAEGGSQGGAFTLVACALDRRIKAAAPTIPFLSDYPNYFKIAPWPASAFENYLKQNPSQNWDQVYSLLSYFDVKNLTPWIECPILMSVGLQDNVCPPRTNFSGYNLVKSEKQFYVWADQGHSVPNQWYEIRLKFFKEKLGLK